MKDRGDAYVRWCEIELPFQHFNQVMPNGKELDVRVRENEFGDIQAFIGVYSDRSAQLMEEYHSDCDASSTEAAMQWCVNRALSFAGYPV